VQRFPTALPSFNRQTSLFLNRELDSQRITWKQ